MKLHRSPFVPALAGVCLCVIGGISALVLRDGSSGPSSPALALATAGTQASLASASATATPAKLPDFACTSEPLHQEASLWRARAEALAARARQWRAALRIEDPNFDDAAALLTTHPDANDIPSLEKKAAELAAAIAEKSGPWQKLIESSPEEFQRTAPRDPASCGTGLEFGILLSATQQAADLRAAGADASDERLRAAEAQIKNMQSSLVTSALYQEHWALAQTRQTLDELRDPARSDAAYLDLKNQYLAAKRQMDDAEQRYAVARMIPLPPQRTKDWRVPAANR